MEIDLRFFFPPFFFPSTKLEAIETKGFNRSREDREPRASYWSFQKNRFLDINTLKTEIDWEKKIKNKSLDISSTTNDQISTTS